MESVNRIESSHTDQVQKVALAMYTQNRMVGINACCLSAYAASRAPAHRCTVRQAASTWQPCVSVPPSAQRIT